MAEEVCAFVRLELLQRIGGGSLESVEGSRGGLAHMRLELGKGIFDSIEIRRSRSRSSWPANQFSRAAFTSARSCSLAWAVFFYASGRADRETSTQRSSPRSHRVPPATAPPSRQALCRVPLQAPGE